MFAGISIYEIAVTDSIPDSFGPFPSAKVGAWQLLTVVHDIFGLQAEAAIYVARSLDSPGVTQIDSLDSQICFRL